MSKSIPELHEQYPYDRDEYYWESRVPYDTALGYSADLHTQSDPLSYLDGIQVVDPQRANAITETLVYLPPEVVYGELGEDAALWLAATASPYDRRYPGLMQTLKERANLSVVEFEAARSWNHNQRYDNRARFVIDQYRFMQCLRTKLLSDVDTSGLLAAHIRPDQNLPVNKLQYYSLQPIRTMKYNVVYQGGAVENWVGEVDEHYAYRMWLDAPSGFMVSYRGRPQAMAGIALHGVDELRTYQLQGVRALKIDHTKGKYDDKRWGEGVNPHGLAPFDWQRLMMNVTEHIGRRLGLKSTSIQAGKNNVWTKRRLPKDTGPHVSLETAQRAYDVPAQRLGYQQWPDDTHDNWHKLIAPTA